MAIAFGVGMVELIIGGILDLVALDLHITEGRAGLLITFFALTFAISGPILLYFTRNFDRKTVTLFALFIFFIANLIVIFSSSYSMVLFLRILSAASRSLLIVLCLALANNSSLAEHRGSEIRIVA